MDFRRARPVTGDQDCSLAASVDATSPIRRRHWLKPSPNRHPHQRVRNSDQVRRRRILPDLGIDAPEVDLFVERTAGPLLAGVGNEVWGCHRYRPRSPCRRPAPRLGVHGRAEGASLHSAAGKARGHRRQRTTVRGELGSVALPKAVPRPRPGRQRGLSGRPTDGRGGTTTRARSGRRRVVRKTRSRPLRRDRGHGIERGHHRAGCAAAASGASGSTGS